MITTALSSQRVSLEGAENDIHEKQHIDYLHAALDNTIYSTRLYGYIDIVKEHARGVFYVSICIVYS